MRWLALVCLALLLAGCKPSIQAPVAPTPTPKPRLLEPAQPAAPIDTAPVPESEKPLFADPPAPVLSSLGYKLVLDFEVGGGEKYYSRYLARPSWPGFASGVTVGVGYDNGYNSRAVILSDWKALPSPQPARLAATAGITGQKAKPKAVELRDILIAWKVGEGVFQRVSLAKFFALTERTFPGFESLRPNAQAALVSLVFNRGSSTVGPRRAEMRAIKKLVPKKDYSGIAAELRAMKRHWRGTDVEAGLVRRRESEAKLMELP